MAKRKNRKDDKLVLRIDPELRANADRYAEEHGKPLSAIVRAILRIWFDPADPRPLPPGVDEEMKRPSRRKK